MSFSLELPSNLAMGDLLAPLYNGEVRISLLSAESSYVTDEQGFADSTFVDPSSDFIPCVWVGKKIDERLVAEQTRSIAGYEISIMQQIGGTPVHVDRDGRIEIKFKPGASEIQALNILAVVNQQNLFWQIYAVDSN